MLGSEGGWKRLKSEGELLMYRRYGLAHMFLVLVAIYIYRRVDM